MGGDEGARGESKGGRVTERTDEHDIGVVQHDVMLCGRRCVAALREKVRIFFLARMRKCSQVFRVLDTLNRNKVCANAAMNK
ncbi:hypothetical protein X777_14928 [Ooceraea biroi]|uniref:Uncharacterized protein n=1 Tax=Ooceraea biroi TaxID=2015173 RepID=A0A026WUG9_OOCBI|nr:hypothetical protein X777_14928 [Ooceraea biroi]